MRVCARACACVRTCACVCVHAHACALPVCLRAYVRVPVCARVHMCVPMCARVHVPVFMHMPVCMHMPVLFGELVCMRYVACPAELIQTYRAHKWGPQPVLLPWQCA